MLAVLFAEIDRRGRALAAFAPQAGKDFGKCQVAAVLRQQAHRVDRYPLSAAQFQAAGGPVGQAMRETERWRVHGRTLLKEQIKNKVSRRVPDVRASLRATVSPGDYATASWQEHECVRVHVPSLPALVANRDLSAHFEVAHEGLTVRLRTDTTNRKTEDSMSHFMIRWKLTDGSAKALVGKPHDRTGAATALVEGFGGKLHSYFISFGEYDGVAICEFPDNTAAAACSMAGASTGAFARFETTTLLTAKEAEAAMKQAHNTKTGYKPPNA